MEKREYRVLSQTEAALISGGRNTWQDGDYRWINGIKHKYVDGEWIRWTDIAPGKPKDKI